MRSFGSAFFLLPAGWSSSRLQPTSRAQHLFRPSMPKFSALIHVDDASTEFEQALKSAAIVNDVLVVADEADKPVKHMVRKAKGRVKTTIPGVSPGAYAMDSYHDWVLVLRPGEV